MRRVEAWLTTDSIVKVPEIYHFDDTTPIARAGDKKTQHSNGRRLADCWAVLIVVTVVVLVKRHVLGVPVEVTVLQPAKAHEHADE